MNQDNIHDALNMLDDELIHEVNKLRENRKKRKNMSMRLAPPTSLASKMVCM